MPPEATEEAPLAERLRRRIRDTGPISIADYMRACLTDAGGYYETRQPIGGAGDFITAPEVSQIFGELIGLWAIASWQAMGAPHALTVAELGPGRGTLMSDALRIWRQFPAFTRALSVALIEQGPVLQAAQETLLKPQAAIAPAVPIAWHKTLDSVPRGPLIVIANEFLDALPIRQFVRAEQGWRERLIGLDAEGAFRLVESEPAPARADLAAFEPRAEPGDIAETRPELAPLIAQLAARAAEAPLTALFMDYGAEDISLGETLQAVRGHRFVDPLTEPGKADLTAHVDFHSMRNCAEIDRLSAYGPMPQGEFLLRLGLAARQEQLLACADPDQRDMLISGANRLVDPQQMGVLFKAFVVTGRELPAPPPFAREP